MKTSLHTAQKLLEEGNKLLTESKYDEVREIVKKILELENLTSDKKGECYLLLGNTYFNKSELYQALNFYKIAEDLLISSKDKSKIIPCYINHAIIFNSLEQYDLAIKYYQKAIKYVDKNAFLQLAQIYNGLGNVYNKTSEFNQSLQSFRKVLKYSKLANSNFGIAMAWSNIAASYLELESYKLSMQYAKKGVELTEVHNFESLCNGTRLIQAEILLKQNNPLNALKILEKTLPICIEIDEKYNLRQQYLLMFQAYKQLGNHEKALYFHELWSEVNYKIISTDNSKLINQLHMQFETEKKEREIQSLQLMSKDSEIKQLRSQMNPHFIFNSISSILHLIQTKQVDKATFSLSKFAHLMREVLKQSSNSFIDIQKEIDLLESYIQLEALQYEKDFSCQIKVDPWVLNFEIPSLLLQPIVENSFKHGLFHKKGKKKLFLHFKYLSENSFSVTVKDNGIGYVQSGEINKTFKKHESFASNSIKKRLALIEETLPINIIYKTSHLKNKQKEAVGTKVVFIFTFLD
jgi:sensor histidine kinase YesM